MSVINPESDVWQSIKVGRHKRRRTSLLCVQIPRQYVANNWPVSLASISSDGRLIAIAGAYGLCHYNSLSGRWKTFERPQEEQSFVVRGGMLWYENLLLVALETIDTGEFKVRVFVAPTAS
jgi:hypothetical protein